MAELLLGIAVGWGGSDGALEIGKQHGDLLALAFQGAFGGEDLLRQIGVGYTLGGGRRRSAGAGPEVRPLPHPDEHSRRFPHRPRAVTLLIEFDRRGPSSTASVELKVRLEGPIRDALALTEERDDLIQDGIKVHARLSLPVAVRAHTHVS